MNMLKLKYLWLLLPFLALGCEDDDNSISDRLVLSHDSYGFAVGGGEFTVLISSTVPYSVSSQGDWLVMTNEEGDRYSYKADENTSFDRREALVIVKALNKSLTDTVHVYQVGKEGLFLDEAERTKNIGLEGGEVEVQVNFTNAGFRVKPEVDWISYIPAKALEQATIILHVQENPDYSDRSGKVAIVSGDGMFSDTVTVVQSQKLGVVLNSRTVTVESEGGELTVAYRENVGKAIVEIPAAYQNWISAVPEAKALNRDTLYLKIAENKVQEERVAVIPVVCGEYRDTLTLTQKGALIAENDDGTYTVFNGADLKNVVDKAKNGDVFKFMTGEFGDIGTEYKLNAGVTFEAVAGEKPVFTGKTFNLNMSSDVALVKFSGIEIRGMKEYLFNHASSSVIDQVILENCKISNVPNSVLRDRKDATHGVRNLIIENCQLLNVAGGNGYIRSEKGFPMNVTLHNTTLTGVTKNDLILYSASVTDAVEITVTNCTFYGLDNAGKYLVNAGKAANAVIRFGKNIIVATAYKGIKGGGTVTLTDNCVVNVSDWAGTDDINADPQFKAPEQGDFTVQNPTVKAAGLGDPRWN